MSSTNAAAVSAAEQAETVPASASFSVQEENDLRKQAEVLLLNAYAEAGTYKAGLRSLAALRQEIMEQLQKGSPALRSRDAVEMPAWLATRAAQLHSLYECALENFSKALQRMAAAEKGLSEKAQAQAAAIEAAELLLMSEKRRQTLSLLQQQLQKNEAATDFLVSNQAATIEGKQPIL